MPIDSVSVDNRMAGYLATHHFVALGHRRIGYISGATLTLSRQERQAGYLDALAEAGIAPDPALIAATPATFGFDDTNAADHGKSAAAELLGLPDPPSAIVGFNDMHALGACAAIRDLGLSVPSDISVVGIDDILLGSLFQPALTTVHQPTEALGTQAVELLARRLRGDDEAAPSHIILEPHLVQRASARPLEASAVEGNA